MRVFSVNQCSYGSTGRIMLGVHEELKRRGNESCVAWARGRAAEDPSEVVFNSKLGVYVHGALARLTDRAGFYSTAATKELVDCIDRFEPDIIQLHNIHGYCLDARVLFSYLKTAGVPVVWTFHSCWPFTGHCTYFECIGCEKWKVQCSNCPQKGEFPKSILKDASRRNFQDKRALFASIERLTIVTPSRWLERLVGESFLSRCPREVIRNGIDTKVFNKGVDGSAARERCEADGKIMLLGVASPWSERKGMRDIIELRKLLGDEYRIVLVGLSSAQLESLPEGIRGFGRTDSIQELAELYAAADLFINPTHEDNYPTVNLEALACGTRVLTYETGGSPECTSNRNECIVTKDRTPESMCEAIEDYFSLAEHGPVGTEIEDQTDCAENYLRLYERLR